MITDSHAHLTYKGLREDIPGVLMRAAEAGVKTVITVGTDVEDSRAAVKAAREHEGVWAAVGVHPHDAGTLTRAAFDEVLKLASDPKVVAVGETGLDYFRDRSPRDLQMKWFKEHASAAREMGLPLIVHDRDAHGDVLKVIAEEAKKGLRGVMHCFSGDASFAGEVLKTGFLISIPGTVTYPGNDMLREVVKSVPLEKCMVETDCPFLSPQPVRKLKNEPAFVRHTVEEVARIKGLSVEDVARITTRAAAELFGLDLGEKKGALVAYPIRRSLYLNITSRCTNSCTFCAKARGFVVKGHDLMLDDEPDSGRVLKAVEERGGPEVWDEVVFCGFGEPLLRLDLVIEVAGELKKRGAKKIRVNTDGLADLVHGFESAPKLKGLVDAVSVSLNAPDEATYIRLCRPGLPGSYGAVRKFILSAKENIPEVTASVVAVPGLDIEACRAVAAELGVNFRVRPFDEVG